jgi:SAM-dependent methyltransferase
MTVYELFRWLTYPLMPTLYVTVRNQARQLIGHRAKVIDVGGRTSPYTIGLNCDVTIVEKERDSEVQEKLNLGLTQDNAMSLKNNRSNISAILIHDFLALQSPSEKYDGLLAIEVIEHIDRDEQFVQSAASILKLGGWAIFTTPNGDYIRNEPPHYNPDHRRHYTKIQLESLLSPSFSEVNVFYAVRTGRFRRMGIKSLKLTRPLRAIASSVANVLNRWESRNIAHQAFRSAHLIAIVKK